MNARERKPIYPRIVLIVLFISLLAYLSVIYGPGITRLISRPAAFKELISRYGPFSVIVFMGFQIIQVLVAVIPGEFVQVAGGYIYGIVLGTAYTAVGILLGSVVAFYIARLLGSALLRVFVSPKGLAQFDFLMNNDKAEIVMFVLFLIPGVPKDILVYIAGLTPIKALKFFVISTLARLPAQVASSFVGANIQEKDYHSVIIVSVIGCILFALGYINKERILAKFHHHGK